MTRTVFAVALALVGLLGLAVRLAPLEQRRLAPEIRDLGASRWIVDDPGTALHLRRVELALAEGRVPQHDPLLAFAPPTEIPALPVYDALLAGCADRWLAHADGDPSLGGVDEADLEGFAAWVGPVAYAFGFAALAWAAWISARGARVPVLLAAALLALAPAAVAATEVGRLDAAAVVLVLLALLVRGTQVAVRAEDALSTILEALLCGVIAGLLTSLSAAGAFLALPTAAALLVRALRGPVAVRPIAVRAGLLFTLVAAFVARLPLADGPWEHMPDGLVARWAIGASDVLLLSAAPFALLLLTAPRDAQHAKRTFARIAALAAMLALLVFELPRAWQAASGPLAAWWEARSIGDAGLADEASASVVLGGIVSIAALMPALRRALADRRPEAVHLALLATTTGALAFAEPATASLFAAAAACALAGALADSTERAQRIWLAAGGSMLLVVAALDRRASWRTPVEREGVLDAIASLRWIRAEVPPGGPFNSSSARSTWGILVDPAAGELVAYHARRPVLAAGAAAFSRPELVREARHLAREAGGEEIVARMRAHGLVLAVAIPSLAGPASGLLGARGVDATWAGEVPLPGATRLLPREVADVSDAMRSGGPGLTVVWSLDAVTSPRQPALVAPR